jgi:hypothetical protein
MSDQWAGLSRRVLTGSGDLTCKEVARTSPCTVEITQLFNGRIAVEVRLAMAHSKQDWRRRCRSFDLSGVLDNGALLSAKGVIIDTITHHFQDGAVSLKGYLYHPGYLEITDQNNGQGPYQKVMCEVTNLPLYSVETYEATTAQAHMRFHKLSDYSQVRHLMNALRTGGVLSQITIEFSMPSTDEQMDKFIHTLCSLLSLSQRAHVWCVGQHWVNGSGAVVRSRYEEPLFYYSRPTRPLIPLTSLVDFVENTIDAYDSKYLDWSLGEAQDLYVQAMSICSVWPQSVGFFTALETLKNAFCRQHGYELQFHLPPGKKFDREFKKKEVGHRVLAVLSDAFDVFNHLPGDDVAALKLKVKNELNRRPYKSVLKRMFQELDMVVDEDDLKWLVRLRDQIIHTGSPQYGGKEPWANNQSSEATRWVNRFAGLVERTFLAILEYQSQFERYDQSVVLVEE